ncbi:MAG: Fic family protein [Candidatus Obscuribacterales bacterium]|nr:Fic family protein [Candidatus Obscuribacterales bacterium]
MPTPAENLAKSLESLEKAQAQGKVAIRSSDLPRADRERLLKNGFLEEVMKGWYIPTRPDQPPGESTAWFASFWDFSADYLKNRFEDEWCLAPEHSLSLQVGNRVVPLQLVVRSPKAKNNTTPLPHHTSILDVQLAMPAKEHIQQIGGLNVFSLPTALAFCSPTLYRQNPTDARAALSAIPNASDVLNILLEGGHTVVAGRLAGAFRNIGRSGIADDIVDTMKSAGYDCREEDPFAAPAPILFQRTERSPYVSRMKLMWEMMRETVLERFPAPPGLPKDRNAYLKQVQDNYVTDAYHSLSIEGYRVSRELIEKVRQGNWNPEADEKDRELKNALAARGYWQAYQAVRQSLTLVLRGENPGAVADEDHGIWYRELFAPGVTAGLLKPADLAGYRTDQVFIRHSKQVPPSKDAVRDLMPALFDLLREEKEPAVRIVLGHFMFVYIHPYMDGNGRTGRFLMNVMLASGGYPWTVIPVERRDQYLRSLEEASVNQNIEAFSELISLLVTATMEGKPEAT